MLFLLKMKKDIFMKIDTNFCQQNQTLGCPKKLKTVKTSFAGMNLGIFVGFWSCRFGNRIVPVPPRIAWSLTNFRYSGFTFSRSAAKFHWADQDWWRLSFRWSSRKGADFSSLSVVWLGPGPPPPPSSIAYSKCCSLVF